jgi:hypothetical protein
MIFAALARLLLDDAILGVPTPKLGVIFEKNYCDRMVSE